MAEYQSRAYCLADTVRLANELGRHLEPGAVLALDGDLGAGKTAFSQALAAALGVRQVVNSPTFTIIKEYDAERFPFYHMDVYRLSEAEAGELGLDDYFYGEGITVVEWASRIPHLLPEQHLAIFLEQGENESRLFRFMPNGERASKWCGIMEVNGFLEQSK